jgi:beta-arrestin
MFLYFFYIFAANQHRIADPSQRENLGIIVQYKVKVKLCITPLGG